MSIRGGKILSTAVTIIGIIISLVLVIVGLKMGVFTSPETLQMFLRGAGMWAPLIFIGIQVVQVVFPIIPGGLTCVAGVLLFGPVWGFVYNYVGICVGSGINFSLAKQYGRPFVERSVSEKVWGKYIKWLDSPKFDLYFALAIFFPVAPDDFLCLLAGLTPMKFRRFATIILLGKPLSLLVYSWGLAAVLGHVSRFLAG
ncbi:MAG: TVP38/TMEM64 family protein [Oscillospiraceae bacterium]|nr:TVP38/TMEM64 family protein [Oscillospiraceae bacterium]